MSDKDSNVRVTGVHHLIVDEDSSGQRLDNYLIRELKGVPKTRLYRALRKGEIRINKGRVRADYRLVVGDQVRIPPLVRPEPSPAVGDPLPPRGTICSRVVRFREQLVRVPDATDAPKKSRAC